MVKFGEFSPLNPDLQCTGKSLLGLGEYEEKRRVLLEKMKREYREQMAQARALQKTGTLAAKNLRGRGYMNAANLTEVEVCENQNENSSVTNLQSESRISHSPALYGQFDVLAEGGSLPFIPTSQEMNNLEHPADELSLPPLSPGTLSISARDRKLADLRQSFSAFSERPLTPLTPRNEGLAALSRKNQDLYQEQLRQQIEEKRKLEAERREQEKKEEEAIMRRLEKQQERMRREFEWEEAQRKALAEKRARQMKEALQRQEELEREAVELRKKTRWNLESQRDCQHNVCLESLPLSAVKVKNLHIPVDTLKSGRCKKQLKGHQSADNPGTAVSVTSSEQSRNIRGGEGTMHLKLYGSEKQSLKEIGIEMHKEINRLSPPTRDHQPSDQKENCINVQFQNDRIPLKMFHNLGSDHNLEDTLPIPVFRSRSPAVHHRTSMELVSFSTTPRRYSEDMQRLVSKWQVPAVQKNNLQTTERFHQTRHNNELTQLGAFRRQLQLEQLRMDEMLRQQQNAKKA